MNEFDRLYRFIIGEGKEEIKKEIKESRDVAGATETETGGFDAMVECILIEQNSNHSFFDKTNIMQNEAGEQWSVPKIVKFAEKNKEKYFKKGFDIKKLKHELKWWDKQNEEAPDKSNKRMLKADTSFPLLVIKSKGYGLSVADGLNRLKKAIDIEKKEYIDVYIIPEKDIPENARVDNKKI